jgi:hypothetical protein
MPARKAKENDSEKVIFSWNGPVRPFKKKDRRFWINVSAIAAISGFVLFLIEGMMPVLVIISLVFLFYIMTTVEPENIEYKITNKGVDIAGQKTYWEEMIRFGFSKRLDSNLLVLETTRVPGRLEIVIDENDMEKIKNALKKHLPEHDKPASNIDKAANWFAEKMP